MPASKSLSMAVLPLLQTRTGIVRQIADLDCKVSRLARNDNEVRTFSRERRR